MLHGPREQNPLWLLALPVPRDLQGSDEFLAIVTA